jgi:CRP/FNR family transcriptional regulator, cyclic AMP receptor protein
MPAADLHVALRTVLCKGLTREQTEQLAAAMVPMHVPAGSVVLHEGEKSTGLLVFLRGTADVLKRGADGENQTLATVNGPTILGEMGLLTDRPRAATVQAVTDCEFHLLTRTQFQRLLDRESLAAYKLIASVADVLADRLDMMDQKILDVPERHEEPAPVEEPSSWRKKLFSGWTF